MSKFCNKCGAELEDDVKFCDKCGAPQEAASSASSAVESVSSSVSNTVSGAADAIKSKGFNPAYIGIGAVGIVAIVLICLIVSLFSGSPKSTVKAYMKAFEKGDVEKMLNVTIPKKIVDEYFEENYKDMKIDKDDYIEVYTDSYKALWDGLKDEGKVKVEYEIKKLENVDKADKLKKDLKAMDVKDLDDVKDGLDKLYDDTNFDSDKVKKAYAAEVKTVITVDKDKAYSESTIILIYKYKGDWYIANPPVDVSGVLSELDDDDYKDVKKDVRKEMSKLYSDSDSDSESGLDLSNIDLSEYGY